MENYVSADINIWHGLIPIMQTEIILNILEQILGSSKRSRTSHLLHAINVDTIEAIGGSKGGGGPSESFVLILLYMYPPFQKYLP